MSKLVQDTVGDLEEEEGDDVDVEVPLPKVTTAALEKIIEFCNHYATEPMTPIRYPYVTVKLDELVQPWYVEFCKQATQPVPGYESEGSKLFYELVEAANFMNIVPLLDITQVVVSAWIKSKSPEELKAMLAAADAANEAADDAAATQGSS